MKKIEFNINCQPDPASLESILKIPLISMSIGSCLCRMTFNNDDYLLQFGSGILCFSHLLLEYSLLHLGVIMDPSASLQLPVYPFVTFLVSSALILKGYLIKRPNGFSFLEGCFPVSFNLFCSIHI